MVRVIKSKLGILGVFLIFSAIYTALLAIPTWFHAYEFMNNANVSQGTVVAVNRGPFYSRLSMPGGKPVYSWSHYVDYMDVNGRRQSLVINQVSSPRYVQGDTVTVAYDARNPTYSKVYDTRAIWDVAFGWIAWTVVALCVGSIAIWIASRIYFGWPIAVGYFLVIAVPFIIYPCFLLLLAAFPSPPYSDRVTHDDSVVGNTRSVLDLNQ